MIGSRGGRHVRSAQGAHRDRERLALAGSGLVPRWALSQQQPALAPGLPAGVYDTAVLDALPGKKPLIKLTYRPPNYETPAVVLQNRDHAQ